MQLKTARKIVSQSSFTDKSGKKTALDATAGYAKNLLRKAHKAERQRKKLARRKSKGLH